MSYTNDQIVAEISRIKRELEDKLENPPFVSIQTEVGFNGVEVNFSELGWLQPHEGKRVALWLARIYLSQE